MRVPCPNCGLLNNLTCPDCKSENLEQIEGPWSFIINPELREREKERSKLTLFFRCLKCGSVFNYRAIPKEKCQHQGEYVR